MQEKNTSKEKGQSIKYISNEITIKISFAFRIKNIFKKYNDIFSLNMHFTSILRSIINTAAVTSKINRTIPVTGKKK